MLSGVSTSLRQVHAYGIANLASTSAVGFPWMCAKQYSTASPTDTHLVCFRFGWGLIVVLMIFSKNHKKTIGWSMSPDGASEL